MPGASILQTDRELWREASRDARAVVGEFCERFAPFSNGRGLKGAAAAGLSGVPLEFLPLERRKLFKAGLKGGTKAALRAANGAQYNYSMPCELGVDATEEQINEEAERLSRECGATVGRWCGAESALRTWANVLATNLGVIVPKRWTTKGLIARLSCVKFWKRQIRLQVGRGFEAAYRGAGWIHRKGELFCSTVTLNRRIARAKANAELLDGLQVVDDETGESLILGDVVAGSVSNPAVRRAELMVRMRGFEEYAIAKGYACAFVTITTPSAYHRVSNSGRRVGGWNETTPKEAQAYLLACWARVRAKWQRSELFVQPFGFRVVEPHHDGTPHWHVVLFMHPDGVAAVCDPVKAEFLVEASEERGAKANRVQVKMIDASCGGATAYLAKYVSKNIDGLGLNDAYEMDEGRASSEDGAARVLAWASRWGIRQFQQVGGPSVTVWRELRRLREPVQGELFERVRVAVDLGQWVDFFCAQGGAGKSKKKHLVQMVYETREGVYDDENSRICGVSHSHVQRDGIALRLHVSKVLTRTRRWSVSRRAIFTGRERLGAQRVSASTRSGVNNCTPSVSSSYSKKQSSARFWANQGPDGHHRRV